MNTPKLPHTTCCVSSFVILARLSKGSFRVISRIGFILAIIGFGSTNATLHDFYAIV